MNDITIIDKNNILLDLDFHDIGFGFSIGKAQFTSQYFISIHVLFIFFMLWFGENK